MQARATTLQMKAQCANPLDNCFSTRYTWHFDKKKEGEKLTGPERKHGKGHYNSQPSLGSKSSTETHGPQHFWQFCNNKHTRVVYIKHQTFENKPVPIFIGNLKFLTSQKFFIAVDEEKINLIVVNHQQTQWEKLSDLLVEICCNSKKKIQGFKWPPAKI